MANYSLPIAVAFRKAIGTWGCVAVIIGMLMSIFGVGFTASFNAPALMSSLSNERAMLPKFFGKTNRFEAPWVAATIATVASCFLAARSYLFLAGMIVFASFVQCVPGIMDVMKFRRDKNSPTTALASRGVRNSHNRTPHRFLHGFPIHPKDERGYAQRQPPPYSLCFCPTGRCLRASFLKR